MAYKYRIIHRAQDGSETTFSHGGKGYVVSQDDAVQVALGLAWLLGMGNLDTKRQSGEVRGVEWAGGQLVYQVDMGAGYRDRRRVNLEL